ncbi:acetyl-CoA carboxylase biotin carboxyl carrier protein subunit [Aquimarina sp. MMG016]|uniref:acetyl-CoA carboxylase biotin carboxyl carrier protein subunit n=1 Tax=Aquimarina sp. MMG016 TaxID=2822690 RepID=UPI001B3A3126|nr:acetyl-CoA carboxylase biotin carboxyl carrier protein subunit [Aquimarina sp. MMG016]MBQ4820979.1 acetyl-CoA carboxylase biotin carboxyl carrier protein subunit [Aquimarina sp. MMG016]
MGTYKVRVNETLEFEFTKDDISAINAVQSTNPSKYHILQDSTSYHTEVTSSDFNAKKYTVSVNNTAYEVTIADTLDQQIAAMGFSLGSSKNVNSVKAPMPGLLLDIHVAVNQEVKEDEPLLILEAMKMENVILSPRDGIIKSIGASKGDAVDKGQLLIEFE